MSNQSRKNYLNYVKDVLGIKHLFLNSKSSQPKKLLISVTDLHNYNSVENDLLKKMISALKLNASDFIIVDEKTSDKQDADYFLKLSDTINDNLSTNTICTYSPRVLLKNAEYKKKAWSDMQNLLLLMKV